MQFLQLPLTVPDYTLLSIRQQTLSLQLPSSSKETEHMHLVVDSTGLKLFGEGEWKVKKHGKEKRRSWLKLHLAVDEKTQAIEACLLTADNVHDSEALPKLLHQIDKPIERVTGDGAYDAYASTIDKGAIPYFPPRKNATRHQATDEAHRLRNHAVSQVGYHGLASWKKKNNYHRRSLVETAMFRIKQLLSNTLQARKIERQSPEIGIKCMILNKMSKLGMSMSEKC